MSGYTKGSWAADQSGDIYVVASKFGIGEAWREDPNWEANARLMATAPELLEALKALVGGAADCVQDSDWPGLHVPIEAALSAIAKATQP